MPWPCALTLRDRRMGIRCELWARCGERYAGGTLGRPMYMVPAGQGLSGPSGVSVLACVTN